MNEAQILLLTAASVAFLHTILGPDHYLVFTAMGKARSWSLRKTLQITLVCGLGHVLGSVIIGVIGIVLGAQLASVVEIEGFRGNLAGWALLAPSGSTGSEHAEMSRARPAIPVRNFFMSIAPRCPSNRQQTPVDVLRVPR